MLPFRKKVVNLQTIFTDNVLFIGVWCNGNTTDSGPVILGSSPSTPTAAETGANDIHCTGLCLFLDVHLPFSTQGFGQMACGQCFRNFLQTTVPPPNLIFTKYTPGRKAATDVFVELSE